MAYDPFSRARPFQYALAFVYSLIIAVLWLPAFALRRVARFVRELGVDSWPRANGSITGGDVRVVHGWVVDYAIGRLEYSYRVAGEYYAGSLARQYPDEQAAWEFVDARRDRPVVVRCKDDNAQVSVLRDADQELSWNNMTSARLPAMIWQHWRDELRRESETTSGDENFVEEDEDVGEDLSEDRGTPENPVGR